MRRTWFDAVGLAVLLLVVLMSIARWRRYRGGR